MRLAKYLAGAGVASRRAAENLIRAGRVTVCGQTVTDPAHDVGEADRVALDGAPVLAEAERVVYALNKPLGVVSTASDPQGRPTVVSLVASRRRLYPVGRLDIDTDGLLLLTDDGPLAHRLTHPSFGVEKTYRATVARPPIGRRALSALRAGVLLEDGPTAPARVRRLGEDLLELTLREGRNRQVRRMCAAVGHPVLALTRTRFGPLTLGDLAAGEHRRLGHEQIEELRAAASAGRGDRRGAASSSRGRGRSPAGSRPSAGRRPGA